MQKINTFFYSLKNSVTDISYYNDIIKANFMFSIKYYYFLSILLAAIYTCTYLFYLPTIFKEVEDLTDSVQVFYPKDLEISIEKQKISINQHEPYFIKLPKDFANDKNIAIENKYLENILAFDSKATIKTYSNYKSLVVVTDSTIIFPEDNVIKEHDLSSIIKNFSGTFDKYQFDKFIMYIYPYLNMLVYLSVPIIFLISLLYFSSNLLYILFMALLLYLIARIFMHSEINYKKSIQIVLHAITLPYIFALLLSLLMQVKIQVNIPYYFTVILLAFSIFALKAIKSSKG